MHGFGFTSALPWVGHSFLTYGAFKVISVTDAVTVALALTLENAP